MRENRVKKMLKEGQTVLGPFVSGTYPGMVEIMGYAGFDFAILDMEHGPLDVRLVEDMCRAADLSGLCPIVRVRKNDPPQILRALDIGSGGVQIPQIETKQDAEAASKAAKFAPLGERGLSPFVRATDYSARGTAITDEQNKETMTVIHVEGKQGVANLEDIIAVPNIDVIFLGPYDLSQSLGIPGQVKDPRVIDYMKKAASKIRAADKAVGTFSGDAEMAKMWIDVGVQYISVCVDTAIFLNACKEIVSDIRGKR